MRGWRTVRCILASACTVAPLVAQGTSVDSAVTQCNGQRITKISIEPMGPEFGGASKSSKLVTGVVRRFHATTRPRVVREFLQVHEGERCSEIKRAETERVLRAQWFIQDARVLVYPDGDGVQLIVATVDEVAILAAADFRGSALRSFSTGSSNLLGRGVYLEGGWRDNRSLRDSYTARFRSAITFGRPIQSNINVTRLDLGGRTDAELRYPFFTDLQRYGFRAIIGRDDDYVPFIRASGEEPLQRVSRSFSSVGGVARIGQPGALLLAGASVSYDGERIGSAVVLTDSGARPYTQPLPALPAPTQSQTRLNLLLGGRALRFLPVEGFDAITGAQDLRLGVQFAGQIGRPLKLSGISTSDFFTSGDIYAGWGTKNAFVGTEWVFSGRRGGNGWDGQLISGRTATYLKPNVKTTTILSLEYVGGNDVRVPYQVPLGASGSGLRGFLRSRDGGERRVIFRGEQRQAFARPLGFADLGAVTFVETGRTYAGSVPFGVTTPWRSAVGVGLLAAVPPRSRQTYRLDAVYALNPDARSRRWEFRLTTSNMTRMFWQDADESRRARERSLISNLFSF
jgi:hypothetical protein